MKSDIRLYCPGGKLVGRKMAQEGQILWKDHYSDMSEVSVGCICDTWSNEAPETVLNSNATNCSYHPHLPLHIRPSTYPCDRDNVVYLTCWILLKITLRKKLSSYQIKIFTFIFWPVWCTLMTWMLKKKHIRIIFCMFVGLLYWKFCFHCRTLY